jgi:hypothetical protein
MNSIIKMVKLKELYTTSEKSEVEDKGGKLKTKRVMKEKTKRVMKEKAKNKPEKETREFVFTALGSELPKIGFGRSETIRELPMIDKRNVRIIPFVKPAERPRQFFQDPVKAMERSVRRFRRDRPLRQVDLQVSGLPTLEEYDQNPEAFAGLAQPQKDELDRQLRERAGRSVSYLQDISDQLKSIVPAVSTLGASIIPFNQLPGPYYEDEDEPPEEGFAQGRAEGESPQPEEEQLPTEDDFFMEPDVPDDDEPSAVTRGRGSKSAEFQNALESAKNDYTAGMSREDFIALVERAYKFNKPRGKISQLMKTISGAEYTRLSEPADSGMPGMPDQPPVGAGLDTRKTRKTRTAKPKKLSKKMLEATPQFKAKQVKIFMKLSKMKNPTDKHKKKLKKMEQLKGAGFFDVIKSIASLGLKEAVKYGIKNPGKVADFLFKKESKTEAKKDEPLPPMKELEENLGKITVFPKRK